MSLETFIAFAIFALVGSVTPGPNTLMLAATGASFGMKRGLPALFGVVLGFSLMVGIVALGLGTIITENPQILGFLRIAGIIMLIWMAWKIANAPVLQSTDLAPTKPAPKPLGFFAAAAFQWVNAKAWLVAVSAVSTYFVANESALFQSAVFTGVFFAAAVIACFLWLGFGTAVGRVLQSHPKYAQAFNIVMAMLLLSSIYLMIS